MQYKDIVKFEPIESIIQLTDSAEETKAKELVSTYVLSDRMADQLVEIVIPQLQYDEPVDNKGLLIVGNYGTGKSHLMSVISALAEYPSAEKKLNNDKVKKASSVINGRFKVIRAELGATTMPLSQFVTGIIEESAAEWGIEFEFPPSNQVRTFKEPLQEFMGMFNEKYPDKGLLFILDELLDYLRRRDDQAIILDLTFLREVGELCKNTRFRFIAGLQEMLFDNPSFQFVAHQLHRVKDRFEQIRIIREDIAFVVSERLLKKTKKQQVEIKKHLQPYTPLFENLNEKMDEFVNLYPIHPTYLETFENVFIAEKREVLKTISSEIKKIINNDIPKTDPGIVAYDSYWQYISENPALRSYPEIREVMDKSKVLSDRIHHAFDKPQYKPLAMRIIAALSVHRLTTDDIYAGMGITSSELRDDLFLYMKLPEMDSEFLQTTIESILNEIMRTVSGQFISYNKENGQYFLDLKKDVDYDELIKQKAATLSNDQLDRYYFELLKVKTECHDANAYIRGFKIWQHEVPWEDRKINRLGYLFFGSPNDRSTAHPPRDFFLYLLQPFNEPEFEDHQKSDEIFFRLKKKDDDFVENLRLYAASIELAQSATRAVKDTYEKKASEYLTNHLSEWLDNNFTTDINVTYKGVTKPLIDIAKGKIPPHATIRELINVIGSVLLSSYFKEISPDYPAFLGLGSSVTSENISVYAQDAMKWIANIAKTKNAKTILDAFELLDGDSLRPANSKYSKWILKIKKKKGQGQVINRSELIGTFDGVEYTKQFRLEPEWLMVIITALVYHGDIILAIPGEKFNSADLSKLASTSIRSLIDFKHLESPKDLPVGVLQELFELLNLPKGNVTDRSVLEKHGIQTMINEANKLTMETVEQLQVIRNGIQCWGTNLISENDIDQYEKDINELKEFFEGIQIYNTIGKLKNFKYTSSDVATIKSKMGLLDKIKELEKQAKNVIEIGSYLTTAQQVLPQNHDWVKKVKKIQPNIIADLKAGDQKNTVRKQLLSLKNEYIDIYLKEHKKYRLGTKDDELKKKLVTDERLTILRNLSMIDLLPLSALTIYQSKVVGLKSCWNVSKTELANTSVCRQCGFNPAVEQQGFVVTSSLMDELDDELQNLLNGWTTMLIDNLTKDPTVKNNFELLKPKQKKLIDNFLKTKQYNSKTQDDLISAMKLVLQGLEKAFISTKDLARVLGNGIPLTLDEFKEKINGLLDKLSKGKEKSKVRVVVMEKDENIED